MPHIVLEISENLSFEQEDDHANKILLNQIHLILTEMLPTDINNCKSRIIKHKDFYAGDGSSSNAFAHLSIKIMPGRTEQLLKSVGENIIRTLENHYNKFSSRLTIKLNTQISLEITELSACYFKSN